MGGCTSVSVARAHVAERADLPEAHSKTSTAVDISNHDRSAVLGADIYRPNVPISPKTLVIMIPGSGNVSREGEVSGDGVVNYAQKLKVYDIWAQALANRGMYVLSFDKRTCKRNHHPLCRDNPIKDIDEQGIAALARDVDDVFSYTLRKIRRGQEPLRVVLFTTSQGTQALALSKVLAKSSGAVLLSPMFGDLPQLFTRSLQVKAHNPENSLRGTMLKNRAETMKSLFQSLARGDFPDNAQIHGASVKFWKSWMEAAQQTSRLLKEAPVPILSLTSVSDPFACELKAKVARIHEQHYAADRNLVVDQSPYPQALTDVVAFIQKTSIIL